MNLVIDIGNTLTKVEVFSENKTVVSSFLDKTDAPSIEEFLDKNGISSTVEAAIVSAVKEFPQEIETLLKNRYYYVPFSHNTPLPIINGYLSPETLGKDRLAAAAGAGALFPGSNVLSVDIGTCIKYDFTDDASVYLGGAISPGFEMRLKSLNTFTGKLPLIEKKEIKHVIGNTTENSILSGVINGILYEINGMVSFYNQKFPQLQVVLSGGDTKYFADKINFRIFAIQNIVTLGLNNILNYNKSVR